jgi:hypothetical protein
MYELDSLLFVLLRFVATLLFPVVVYLFAQIYTMDMATVLSGRRGQKVYRLPTMDAVVGVVGRHE